MKKFLLLLMLVISSTIVLYGQVFSVSDSTVYFSADSSQKYITVNCNQYFHAQSNQDWLSAYKLTDDSTLLLVTRQNFGIARYAQITLTADDSTTYSIDVSQSTGIVQTVFSVSDSLLHLSDSASDQWIVVKCNKSWQIQNSSSWIFANKVSGDTLVRISASVNHGVARDGYIYLLANDSTRASIYVSQETGIVPTVFTVSDSMVYFTNTASNKWVWASCNKSWYTYTSASWLSAEKLSGDTMVNITASANYGTARNGYVYLVANDSTKYLIYVSQATGIVPTVFTVSDSMVYFTNTASNKWVWASCNKSWYTYTSASWLSAEKLSGDTMVNISASANYGTARNGYVYLVANDSTKYSIYVSQETGIVPTVFTVADSMVYFTNTSSDKWVWASCNKSWYTYTSASWLSAEKLSGDTMVNISASANYGTARNGYIYLVANDSTKYSIYVSQETGIVPTVFTVSDSMVYFTNTSSDKWVWASCNKSWYTYTSASWLSAEKLSGDTMVNITASANYGTARNGYVYLVANDSTKYSIYVSQETGIVPTVFTVADSMVYFTNTSSDKWVWASCNKSWYTYTSASWLSAEKLSGDTMVNITASANYGTARNGYVYLVANDSTKYSIYVSQETGIVPTVFSVSDSMVYFTNTSSDKWVWASCNKSWYTYTSASWLSAEKLSGDTMVNITASANYGTARNGYVYLVANDSTKYSIYVSQETGIVPTVFTVADSIVYFTNTSSDKWVWASSNKSWYTYTSASWLSAEKLSGDTMVNISASANYGTARNGYVYLVANDSTKYSIYVSQETGIVPTVFKVSDSSVYFNDTASNQLLWVNCNRTWNIYSSDSWLTAQKYSGDSLVKISANTNYGGVRDGFVYLIADDSTKVSIYVYQTSGIVTTVFSVADSEAYFTDTASNKLLWVNCNRTWYTYSSDSWLTAEKLSGDSLVRISASTNYGSAREGVVYLVADDSTQYTIDVYQATGIVPTVLTVSDSKVYFTDTASSRWISVNCNKSWNTYTSASWIIAEKLLGDSIVNISVSSNNDEIRNGFVYLVTDDSTSVSIYVSQVASGNIPTVLSVSDSNLNFTSSASRIILPIICNKTWYVYCSEIWLTAQKLPGDSLVYITTTTNSGIARQGYVSVVASDSTKYLINVYQNEFNRTVFKYTNIPGELSTFFTQQERLEVTHLTVEGLVDVRDLLFIRDSLPLLRNLNIENVKIKDFTGDLDSLLFKAATLYPANTIPQGAFKDKITLTEIYLPSTLVAIDSLAFGGCVTLSKIIVNSNPNRIDISETAFKDVNKNTCSIVVPENTSTAIFENSLWREFATIEENEVITDLSEKKTETTLQIFPNPVVSSLFITGADKGSVINLFAQNGVLLDCFTYYNDMEISFTNYKAGIYIIVIGNKSYIILK
ncbi:MAG: leucine-rich repeat protein [Bacteroidales bacterium]|nr:leucine-rich repeat protein [Bacteroidales bacterium]